MVFTNEEMVDMLLIYGEYFQNAKQAESGMLNVSLRDVIQPALPSLILLVDFERLEA